MKPALLALLLLPVAAQAADAGGSLVHVEAGEVAGPAKAGPDATLLAFDGELLAAGGGASWQRDAEGAWQLTNWRPDGSLLSIAIEGARTVVLSGSADGALGAIDELSAAGGPLTARPLPLPPLALRHPQAAWLGTRLYVAGNGPDGTLQFFSLDASPGAARLWQAHETPGGAGLATSLVGQTLGIHLTRRDLPDAPDRLMRWKAGEGWSAGPALPGQVLPGGARDIGQAHVLYLVRASGAPPRLVSFQTITRALAPMDDPAAAGARGATAWRDGFAWLGDGGVRYATLLPAKHLLRWVDWVVIAVYLAAMTGIGLYFYLREKRLSTADFFVGSRTIPFWAAGVSLYATNTSSISYIAIPAKAFETNWQYLTNNLVAILGLMFVAVWIVPLLRRLDLMSVFQYLEIRFHPVIRTLASGLCMLVQIGSRLSVILFLPSLAIATMTGIDVAWCILLMGAVTIAYTALGGMKAVIWTDFAQLFVMFGGALFAIGYIVLSLDGGAGEFLSIAGPENKMKLLDWSWDLTEATVWGFIFLVLFDVVLTFPKDQVLMQRVLSTSSAKDAKRSVWMFAAIMIPGGFMFYFIGTALYVFYRGHPERMDPQMQIDATFPLFIASELPVGVTGLIIAGILAASMSTLSSILNSVATLASVDFYEKLVRNPDPRTSVRFAELMTVVTGLIGIGAAWLLSRYDIHSLFDVSIELAGLLGGGFAGAYTLGMFTRRANWQGVSIGIASAIALTTLAWTLDLVHPYFYLAISIMICIVVGYLASLPFPPPAQPLKGLTIHDGRALSAGA